MLNVHYLTTQHDNSELFFHVLQCNVLLSTISVGTCPFTLSNSSQNFAVDPPLTYVIPSSINCPFHTPFQILWLLSIVTSELLTSAMTIVCPLLVSCLPLEFTPFQPLAKPCKWQCLSAKETLWMFTIWLVQRPCTSKLALLSLLQTACCAPLF